MITIICHQLFVYGKCNKVIRPNKNVFKIFKKYEDRKKIISGMGKRSAIEKAES